MFVSPHVKALYRKGALKLVDVDGEWRRVVEATFVIEPFQKELAHELGEDIATHLFDERGRLRDELDAISLRVSVGEQRVYATHHADLQDVAMLSPVTVKDCSAERVEEIKKGQKTGRAWLKFAFVLVFDLVGKEARNFAIDEFGNTLLLSFEALQHALPLDADVDTIGTKEPARHKLHTGRKGPKRTRAEKADAERVLRQQREGLCIHDRPMSPEGCPDCAVTRVLGDGSLVTEGV